MAFVLLNGTVLSSRRVAIVDPLGLLLLHVFLVEVVSTADTDLPLFVALAVATATDLVVPGFQLELLSPPPALISLLRVFDLDH